MTIKRIEVEIMVPATVLCGVEYDSEGTGSVVAVYEVRPGGVAARDVVEHLDGEGRLSELDREGS